MQTTPLDFLLDDRSPSARPLVLLFAAIAAIAGSGCAETCSLRDNGDGTQTLACGGDPVVLGGCTATENADGGQTIACADGTHVTVPGGVACGLLDPGDGTITFSCSDGTEWTFVPDCESRL
ncbi:MAG: hypothetical protein H5U40_07490, partial [Polyangiaceae bacterium]|nr:hypothetical protein [Polyangiaceae bacterium]